VRDYFQQFPGLRADDHYNGTGFWQLPIPVTTALEVAEHDVVVFDEEGYPALRKFLEEHGIEHILLCGYATDLCVCSTTAGYENLRRDFNVFLVGDATQATCPANRDARYATNQAISVASLKVLITQVSWISHIR
jgi:nicotinamidase-related amidase